MTIHKNLIIYNYNVVYLERISKKYFFLRQYLYKKEKKISKEVTYATHSYPHIYV